MVVDGYKVCVVGVVDHFIFSDSADDLVEGVGKAIVGFSFVACLCGLIGTGEGGEEFIKLFVVDAC